MRIHCAFVASLFCWRSFFPPPAITRAKLRILKKTACETPPRPFFCAHGKNARSFQALHCTDRNQGRIHDQDEEKQPDFSFSEAAPIRRSRCSGAATRTPPWRWRAVCAWSSLTASAANGWKKEPCRKMCGRLSLIITGVEFVLGIVAKPDPAPACVGLLLHADEHPRPDLHPFSAIWFFLTIPATALCKLCGKAAGRISCPKAEHRKARHSALSHARPRCAARSVLSRRWQLKLFQRAQPTYRSRIGGDCRRPSGFPAAGDLKPSSFARFSCARADGGAPFHLVDFGRAVVRDHKHVAGLRPPCGSSPEAQWRKKVLSYPQRLRKYRRNGR